MYAFLAARNGKNLNLKGTLPVFAKTGKRVAKGKIPFFGA